MDENQLRFIVLSLQDKIDLTFQNKVFQFCGLSSVPILEGEARSEGWGWRGGKTLDYTPPLLQLVKVVQRKAVYPQRTHLRRKMSYYFDFSVQNLYTATHNYLLASGWV